MCIEPASRKQLRHQRGVTLVELIVFIVIISIAATGILLVMNIVMGQSADPLVRKQAFAIAESLLEEIQLLPVNPAACNTALGQNSLRTGAGCVTDYQNYRTTMGVTEFSSTTPIGNLSDYNIASVTITALTTFGGTAIDNAVGYAYSITVTVTHPAINFPVEATGYRAGQ